MKISEPKNPITKIRISLDRPNSRMETKEEGVSELEDRLIELFNVNNRGEED